MLCRQCGTEIADKALVCFRCGAATAESAATPSAQARQRSSLGLKVALFAFILLVLLILFAVYTGPAPSLPSDSVRRAIIAGVAAIVVLRAISRRR